MTYSSLKFELVAKINDLFVDVVQFTGSYELNRIPKATMVLPVGREVSTMILSNSHIIAGDTAIQVPATVYLNVLQGAGLGNDHAIVPVGSYVLFDGYVTGVGYRRKTNSLSIAVQLTHWLSDLNFSSTLSASSHPGNPYMLTFFASTLNTAVDIPGGGAAGAAFTEKHWVGKTRAQTLAKVDDVKSDLWGNVILKWFLGLTESDRLLIQPDAFGTEVAKNDSKNEEAKAALEKFSGDKLEIDVPESAEIDVVVKSILEDIAVTSDNGAENTNHFAAMANTTLWNKLVGDLGQKYMFSVIPYPEEAKVVPFIAGLQDIHNPRDEKYTIMARDITFIDLNTHLPRPLRAVGILGGHSNASGVAIGSGTTESPLRFVSGMFIGQDEGLVLYKSAPRWATEIGIPWVTSLTTSGVGSFRSSAFDPRVAPPAPKGTGDELAARRAGFSTILDNYARAMYAQEVLKNRIGQLSGVVRFDIAPGSTISIEGQRDTFTDDGPIDVRYATVLRVTYAFDAESQGAGTSFELGHIRNKQENESASTSIEKHPLYTNKWIGSTLIEKIS